MACYMPQSNDFNQNLTSVVTSYSLYTHTRFTKFSVTSYSLYSVPVLVVNSLSNIM
jgi:hypothetical protein